MDETKLIAELGRIEAAAMGLGCTVSRPPLVNDAPWLFVTRPDLGASSISMHGEGRIVATATAQNSRPAEMLIIAGRVAAIAEALLLAGAES